MQLELTIVQTNAISCPLVVKKCSVWSISTIHPEMIAVDAHPKKLSWFISPPLRNTRVWKPKKRT